MKESLKNSWRAEFLEDSHPEEKTPGEIHEALRKFLLVSLEEFMDEFLINICDTSTQVDTFNLKGPLDDLEQPKNSMYNQSTIYAYLIL